MDSIEQKLTKLWKKEYPEQDSQFVLTMTREKITVPINSIFCVGSPKNMSKARRYLKLVKEGIVIFPPLLCINHQVVDGYHRLWAYKQAGFEYVTIYRNIGTGEKSECA